MLNEANAPSLRLVVIGGGLSGHRIAYQLKEVMAVTLIDPKSYFEVPMAFPRLLVEPEALPARLPFRDFLSGAEHLAGRAVGMDDHHVAVSLVNGGETRVAFDYAVIATGSRYADPLVKAEAPNEGEREAELADAHRRLRAARRVVVVGGGAVGVEVAAEIRETLPDKHVTLIHAGARLLETAPGKFPAWAEHALADIGIEIILGCRVLHPTVGEQPEDGNVQLADGRRFPADLIIWAVGASPVTDFVAATLPDAVQPNGLLRVDEALRVDGHPTIFVAGDVTNLPEARLGIITDYHVASIVSNLRRIAKARPGDVIPRLQPYRPKLPGKGAGKVMIVTLGRADGLSSLPFGQFRFSGIARNLKARDMLVGRYRKGVGLPT